MLLSLHRLAGVQQSINDALRENRLRRAGVDADASRLPRQTATLEHVDFRTAGFYQSA
jgi:hypothetical protein